MSEAPLIPAPLYGLRTWRVATGAEGERLTGAYDGTPWPDGGEWLHAECGHGDHAAPDPDCVCGIYGWHPDRRSARRVLASRFDVPGIVEAAGAVQVHDEGFRAERARPYALVVLPGRNAKLVARLAERYRAEMVEVDGADELVAWCRDRGLGLEDEVVDQLLGADGAAQRVRARRRRTRKDAGRIAAALVVAAALLSLGGAFVSGPPSPNGVYGRTGWVIPPRGATCPQPQPRPLTRTGTQPPAPRPGAHC
jgi:hypothetical protein